MQTKFTLSALLLILLCVRTTVSAQALMPDANGVLYVKKGSTGNGSSWSNAAGELAEAVRASRQSVSVKQIWVAGGVYKPAYAPVAGATSDPRDVAFYLTGSMKLYGGFAGTESLLSERDLSISANKTTMSGDLGVEGDASDNCYHVVVSDITNADAVLDGFTISGGAGTTTTSWYPLQSLAIDRSFGGGMTAYNSRLTISNCTFSGNQSRVGAGLFNNRSLPKIINCVFSGNATAGPYGQGGAIYNLASTPTIDASVFVSNKAYSGGAIYDYNLSSLSMNNCLFCGQSG